MPCLLWCEGAYVCVCLCMCERLALPVRMLVTLVVHTCVCVRVCVCVCAYTHARTRVQTDTQTLTHKLTHTHLLVILKQLVLMCKLFSQLSCVCLLLLQRKTGKTLIYPSDLLFVGRWLAPLLLSTPQKQNRIKPDVRVVSALRLIS